MKNSTYHDRSCMCEKIVISEHTTNPIIFMFTGKLNIKRISSGFSILIAVKLT